jgi:exonuclease SbcC
LLEQEQALAGLVEEVCGAEERVAALERLEEEQERQQEALGEMRVRQAGIHEQVRQHQATLKEDGEKFALLKAAEAVCPVCEGELSSEKRMELGRRLKKQRLETENRLSEATVAESALAQQIAATGRHVETRARELAKARRAREQLAQARERHNQCRERLRELPGKRAEVVEMESLLRDQSFAPAERQRLAELDEKIAALAYDQGTVEALKRRIRELTPFEQELPALQAAEATRKNEEEHASRLAGMIAEREAETAADAAAQAALEEELAALPEATSALQAAEGARDAASARQRECARQLAGWEEKLDRCARLADEAAEKRAARAVAEKEKINYEELSRIFGRNGIQALIIENAVPEIEAEANALLARLTDNQMRVAFRTQRDLKNQGVAETLEIDISDEMGTRKLECFSGGESFRVHFAIRIALSKLLARRAGARLQTLIIDEGFGSQDSEGRERLVGAIHAVQEDFDKILVITHIDELKDAFPTRIEVTKTHLGSQIQVV